MKLNRIKGSALYLVIVIALVIGLICSALILAAYYFKAQSQKKSRFDQLQNNLASGINVLLAGSDTSLKEAKSISLFNGDGDTVSLQKKSWGLYDIGIVKAFIQKDTVFKSFSIANSIDSTKWSALYLIDEDRPISISGKTTIKGDAYIPKAGINTAYVDNKAYEGDKRLIIGKKHNSDKKLPSLSQQRLDQIQQLYSSQANADSLLRGDSITKSFLLPTRFINFKKKVQTLANLKASGNLVLLSDTTITIESTADLKNVIIVAKQIIVKENFAGSCQLFARDSIVIEKNTTFNYPSCLGLFRFEAVQKLGSQQKIAIGENTVINGTILTYVKQENANQPSIILGKDVIVKGQIYADGLLEFKDKTEIDGSVYAKRFVYRNSFTLYENYLINITLNAPLLSRYYLSSDLLPATSKKKKILQWLKTN